MRLEDVFDDIAIDRKGEDNGAWWEAWRGWLNEHGYDLVAVVASAWFFPPKGISISGGKAQNGASHAVVVLNGKLAHDPHEGWNGLKEVEDYVVIYPTKIPPYTKHDSLGGNQ
jgi:hypothetical protein